jgi:hypothetical protein
LGVANLVIFYIYVIVVAVPLVLKPTQMNRFI